MPIIFALLAQDTNVLCEHTLPSHQGNFSQIARQIVSTLKTSKDDKVTYAFQGYVHGSPASPTSPRPLHARCPLNMRACMWRACA
jgi:hypothetical protein